MKKFDKKIVDQLVISITKQLNKHKNKRENIHLSLKENNIIKYINKDYSEDILGVRNWFWYEKLGKHLLIKNFLKVKNFLLKLNTENIKIKKVLTEKQKIWNWANRLSSMADISKEQAIIIANKKIEYKNEKIEEMEERQANNYSKKRESLINKMVRANPLRRIKDSEHANNIIRASIRHNDTNYEDKLEEWREKSLYWEIEKGEVKEYARTKLY